MHDIGIFSWNLHILIAIDNQGWLRDKGHIILRLSAPAFDGLQLGQKSWDLHGLVCILSFSLTHTTQNFFSFQSACFIVIVEDVAFRVDPLQTSLQHVAEGFSCHLIDFDTATRTCSCKNQAVDQGTVKTDDFLGDKTTHRKTEQIDFLMAQGLDNGNSLLCHSWNSRSYLALTGSDARQV